MPASMALTVVVAVDDAGGVVVVVHGDDAHVRHEIRDLFAEHRFAGARRASEADEDHAFVFLNPGTTPALRSQSPEGSDPRGP